MIIMQEADPGSPQGGLQGTNHLGLGNTKPCRTVPIHHHFPLPCGCLQGGVDIHQAIDAGHAFGHLPGQLCPAGFIHRINLGHHG